MTGWFVGRGSWVESCICEDDWVGSSPNGNGKDRSRLCEGCRY